MERNYASVTVTPKAERSLRAGHPWVYGEEITSRRGECENGDVVDVFSNKGKYLGSGYINDNSKIAVRVVSRNANDCFDEDFYARRVRYAVSYRLAVMGDDFSACRLVFGEADGFPGLTVDKFGDVLVTEVLSLGTEKVKDVIYGCLVRELAACGVAVRAIYERSDSPIRAKEGLPAHTGFYKGEGLLSEADGHVLITENGVTYDVDYINGQKTGFFLDQKYNRLAAARIAKGKRVLDCFTHTGAFALCAAKAQAASVTAVDISEEALASARKNAELSGLSDRVSFVCADVFDLLSAYHAEKKNDFDFIILDPPAFTKSGSTVAAAYRGYKEINMKAMKLLPRGGYLATCSCSHFMTAPLFEKMLRDAASDAGVSLRLVERRGQCADHPVLWGVPETEYLKFYIFQVV